MTALQRCRELAEELRDRIQLLGEGAYQAHDAANDLVDALDELEELPPRSAAGLEERE